MVVALLVVGTLSAAEYLTVESSETLADDGSRIGQPRAFAVDIVNTTLPPPSEWSETTVPPVGETLYDIEIRTGSDCLHMASRQITAEPCDGSDTERFSLENVEDDTYRITSSATLECWKAAGRRGPPVTTRACAGDADELWRITMLDRYRFTVESTVSGNCIEMTTKLIEAGCSESDAQIFTLDEGST
jgi:hypothetical protein